MSGKMKSTFARFLKKRHDSQGERYPRTPLDSSLEYLRFRKVDPYIPKGVTLLDIGTSGGRFLHYLSGHVQTAVGINLYLTQTVPC